MSDITMRLELVALPVSDVDRAKAFYVQAGFNADHDHVVGDDLRFVQLTPPVSAWGRFVVFSDPDGNGWAVQQIIVPA